ncbi:GNAT family N-acetyltransferase [Rathayibacter sp. YIM 133350]|uniref:GNAT family N-acetyltransferase n=1 Tax=Rathayibacter sp. YIM 133350 TaxID=3131992 RepID=UPI00307FA1FF
MPVTVSIEPARQPDVELMLAGSEAYSHARYPVEACFLLDVESLERPEVSLYVARGALLEPLGMLALVDNGDGTAELKRMFVHEDARGQGVGTQLIGRVEADAVAAGVRRIVLETGPFHEAALALYGRAGYERIPLFGQYEGEKYSICMAKDLALDARSSARV